MTSEWREARLSELCSVITDGAHKSPPTVPTGMPMASVKDLTRHGIRYQTARHISLSDYEELQRTGCCPRFGDVLIAKDGNSALETVCVHVDKRDICLLSSVAIFRPGPDLDSSFLKYFLESPQTKYILKGGYVSGSAIPRVVLRDFKMLPVFIPSKDEQVQISSILFSLDEKIEHNRKTSETLEGIAKALFKSWFVDFDPVRAKVEGRPTGLPAEISDLFPDSFEDSELGEIPSGWKVDSFTSQFNILGGGTPKTSIDEFWGGDLPWFSVVDAPFDSDCWVIETQKSITHRGLENCSSDLFRKGTTIISARGTVGKVCLVGAPMAMNQSCYALQSKQEQQDTYCYYSTKEIVETLKARSHGSVFSTITRDTLKGVDVCQPEKAVINAFEELSNPLLEKIKVHVDESRTLTSLRDALLPRLISGELRVPDAEKMLEEVGI